MERKNDVGKFVKFEKSGKFDTDYSDDKIKVFAGGGTTPLEIYIFKCLEDPEICRQATNDDRPTIDVTHPPLNKLREISYDEDEEKIYVTGCDKNRNYRTLEYKLSKGPGDSLSSSMFN